MRESAIERAIRSLDEQIKVLQLAREHLYAQQQHVKVKSKASRPRIVKTGEIPA